MNTCSVFGLTRVKLLCESEFLNEELMFGENSQAAKDGVDVITLSIGPDEPPEDTLTFLSMFDIFLLHAHRAGIFVAQAAGNKGPAPRTVASYSPWTMGVGACNTDRGYSSNLLLGDGQRLQGVGLSGE